MQKRFGPLKKLNEKNLEKVSDGPGIYGLYDTKGKQLYVGRAKRDRLPERIEESAKNVKKEGGNPVKFGFIPTQTVEDAKKLETRILRKRKPPFNEEEKGK